MNRSVEQALRMGGIADMTTIGRKSGMPRRIEIYFHHFDGDLVLTGRPGRKRDWEANIETSPRFMLHLKGEVTADVAVVGERITDRAVRTALIRRALVESWGSPPERVDADLDEWVEHSPLVKFRPVWD